MPRSHIAAALHAEGHRSQRAGWLRASVLGANDGIVSTASLLLGIAASDVELSVLVTAGLAALVAGAMSMAVGEYVSVNSQRDMEQADIARERWELENVPERELEELTRIYMHKGVPEDLARQVAIELSKDDPLKVHLAEELGITDQTMARPMQAAVSSAISFSLGAALPFVAITVTPASARIVVTIITTLVALGVLGATGARIGGAPVGRAVLRTLIGGALAMSVTMGIGQLLGRAVG